MAIAAAIAHEMRTPLLTIRNQAQGMEKYLPSLVNGYQLAVAHGLCEPVLRPFVMDHISTIGKTMTHEVDRSNAALDMLLASARLDQIDRSGFRTHSIKTCIAEAVARYAFGPSERQKIVVASSGDFRFYGSDTLMTLVLFNLLKNALYAINAAGKGSIGISTEQSSTFNRLSFVDTGTGIDSHALSNMFGDFFTTKKAAEQESDLPFAIV